MCVAQGQMIKEEKTTRTVLEVCERLSAGAAGSPLTCCGPESHSALPIEQCQKRG